MPFYRVTGIPSNPPNPDVAGPSAGLTAFMPHLNRMAASGAQQYKYLRPGSGPAQMHPVYGMDSTAPSGDLGDIALMGGARSVDAPNAWWPNDYDALPEPSYWPGAGMPIQMYDPVRPQDTTMLPVPAVSFRAYWQRNQANLAYGVGPAGQRQVIAWPRQLQRWLPRNSLAEDTG